MGTKAQQPNIYTCENIYMDSPHRPHEVHVIPVNKLPYMHSTGITTGLNANEPQCFFPPWEVFLPTQLYSSMRTPSQRLWAPVLAQSKAPLGHLKLSMGMALGTRPGKGEG